MAYVNVDNILDTLAVELIRDKSNKRALESRERMERNQLAQQASQFDKKLNQLSSQFDRTLGQKESEFERTLAQNAEQFEITSAPLIRAIEERETGDKFIGANLGNAQARAIHIARMMNTPEYREGVRRKLLENPNLSFSEKRSLKKKKPFLGADGESLIDAYIRTEGLPEPVIPSFRNQVYSPEIAEYVDKNFGDDIMSLDTRGNINYLLQLVPGLGGN